MTKIKQFKNICKFKFVNNCLDLFLINEIMNRLTSITENALHRKTTNDMSPVKKDVV